MPHISRFKLKNSDRDGFTRREITLVKDGPFKVATEEFDIPPPSKRSLGGEGDLLGTPRANSCFEAVSNATVVEASRDNPQVDVGIGGITHSLLHPWMRVAATDATVNITADPQISRGQQSDVLTVQCISNNLVLDDGTGLDLTAGRTFTMTSASIVTFIYNTSNNVWLETSRTQ